MDTDRDQPLDLGRPRRVRSRLIMNLPTAWYGDGWDRDQTAAGVRYAAKFGLESPRRFVLDSEVEVLRRVVEPGALAEYFRLQEDAREDAGAVLTSTVDGERFRFQQRALWADLSPRMRLLWLAITVGSLWALTALIRITGRTEGWW